VHTFCGPQAHVLNPATSVHKVPHLRMRRPCAVPQELSPQCAWARAASSSGAPRFLSDNILALERDLPGRPTQHWSDLWSQVSLLLLVPVTFPQRPHLVRAMSMPHMHAVHTYAIYLNMARGAEVHRRALGCARWCSALERVRRNKRFPLLPQKYRHADGFRNRIQAAQVSAGPVAVWHHIVAHGQPLMQRNSEAT
jgi:hypothetical protein